jgi:hypothetical protein
MVVVNRVVVEVMVMIMEVVIIVVVNLVVVMMVTQTTEKFNKDYLESVGNNKGCMQNFSQKCSGSSY